MVNDVSACQLTVNILDRNTHLRHKHHCVIRKVGKLVDCLTLIVCLGGNNNLGGFLAHFFEYFVYSLLEQIGCI